MNCRNFPFCIPASFFGYLQIYNIARYSILCKYYKFILFGYCLTFRSNIIYSDFTV